MKFVPAGQKLFRKKSTIFCYGINLTDISNVLKIWIAPFFRYPHCHRLWSKFSFNQPSRSLYSRVCDLKCAQIRSALAGVETTSCLEVRDYRLILSANLIFESRSSSSGRARSESRFQIRYPHWVMRLGEWKSTYFHFLKDSHRSNIHMSELCSIRWMFSFKHDDWGGQDQQW